MTYWLIQNEWFSAWATDGNFSLQSQGREGIYILKHTDINQAQTLPVLVMQKQGWQLPLDIPFPSSLLPTVSSAVWSTASPTLPCYAGKLPLVKEEHLAWAVQAHANRQPTCENLLNCCEVNFFPLPLKKNKFGVFSSLTGSSDKMSFLFKPEWQV